MKFPVLAVGPKGFTWLFLAEEETKRLPIGFIGIYQRYQSSLSFFDSASTVWRLESIRAVKPVPFWQRLWGSLREVDVAMEFASPRPYDVDDFRSALRQAVDADDDVLTQHERREEVIRGLNGVRTVAEGFRWHRWVRKDFRKGTSAVD